MRNVVFFRTNLFENKEPKPHSINPRCFGEDLISWLWEKLQGNSFSLGKPIQEDYGWGLVAENDYWVAAGVMEDSIDVENPEWLITINYDPGPNLIKSLFKKADHSLQLRICEAINSALRKESSITDIRWCDEKETDCGENPH